MEFFSLSPLRTSNKYRYRDRWKSDNLRESNKEKKQKACTKKLTKKLRLITLQEAIEKSPISQ